MKSSICFVTLILSAVTHAATPIDGIYTNGFGGYSYLPSNVNTYNNGYLVHNPKYKSGYEAGASIGYKSNPMRYEGEITYLKSSLSDFYANSIRLNSTGGIGQGVVALANIYYDFPSLNPLLQPFIGGGVGYGWFHASLKSNDPINVQYSASNNDFAYQATGGVTFNFAENYALNINYRYIASSHLSSFGSVFQAHVANAGATYRFDGPKYK